jgi:hypothetical protein
MAADSAIALRAGSFIANNAGCDFSSGNSPDFLGVIA